MSAEDTIAALADRFLDRVCLHYGPDPHRGPAAFEEAAALLDAHPDIASVSLHTAAAAGDIDAVERLLEEDPASVDHPGGPFQWTPLMYAAYARLPGVSSYRAGKALLAAGADPNVYDLFNDTYRFTVLTGVFGDGEGGPVRQPPHPDMPAFARDLLEAGAHPNECQGAYNRCFSPDDTHLELMLEFGLTDSDPTDWWLTEPGREPGAHRTMHFQLIIALRWGFAERARLLIEHGVDIDTPDNNYYPTYTAGYTPYQVALMRGLPEIADLIAARGGRVDPLGAYESFQAACMQGDRDTATRLAADHQGVDPDKDRELLQEAAGNGNVAAVDTMIALGFELNPTGTRTPLHVAAYKGHVDVLRRLIDAGADTTQRDPDYHTPPIAHAMHNFQDAAVALLMDCPMDVFTAAALGRTDRLKEALADNPALVDARFRSVRTGPQDHFANDWATPLWYAVVNGQADAVGVLLHHGADPGVANPEGRSIVDFAVESGREDIVAMLRASVRGPD